VIAAADRHELTLDDHSHETIAHQRGVTGAGPWLDRTCVDGDPGELAPSLVTSIEPVECNSGGVVVPGAVSVGGTLTSLAATPLAILPLGPDEAVCYSVRIQRNSDTPETLPAQQSDVVTWRYRFTAQA
jgi:hypothetical protein